MRSPVLARATGSLAEGLESRGAEQTEAVDAGVSDPAARRTAIRGRRGDRPAAPPDITTWVGQAGFSVAMRGGHHGAVRLVPGARRVGLVVAHDLGPGSPLADDLAVRAAAASTTVWAHADGAVLVRAVWAPPALLVPADPRQPVTMVPRVPGDPGGVVLEPGDRLVVLTATAFDEAPQVVARLVRGDDGADRDGLGDLRTVSDVTLLHRLLRRAPGAGGAVLTRTAPPTLPRSAPLPHST